MVSTSALPATLRRSSGFTLTEMLVVLAVSGVLLGIAALNVRPLANDLQSDAARLVGYLKQVRTRAMATTSAYRVVQTTATTLQAQQSKSCNPVLNTWTTDPAFTFRLVEGISFRALSDRSTLVCFSSRGLADQSRSFTLQDAHSQTLTAEVYMGGAVELR